MKNIFYHSSRLFGLLLIISMSGFYAYACLWAAGRSQVGKRIQIEGVAAPEFIRSLTTHEDRAYWEKTRKELEKQRENYSFFENGNNLAVALIHLGQIKEAILLLEEVEKKRPGQYITAANLGTAYELNGENQKALDWIREGVTRNKDSHYGTEWLHIKILEAKLAIEKEPDWLKKHSVLEGDFSAGENPQQPKKLAADHLGQQKSLAETEDALIYQLHERLEFVKPPDPIVADLLVDLSKVFALLRTSEHAKATKELAFSYGAVPEVMKSSETITENENKETKSYIIYGILGAIVVLVIGFFYAFLRKRKSL